MRLSARRIACVDRCFTQRNEPAASSSRQSRLLRRVVNCGSEFRPQRPYLYLQGSAISGHSLIAKESAEKDAQALPSKVGRCHSWVGDFRSQPRVVLALHYGCERYGAMPSASLISSSASRYSSCD